MCVCVGLKWLLIQFMETLQVLQALNVCLSFLGIIILPTRPILAEQHADSFLVARQ